MEVIRNYEHRVFGAIGQVALTVPDGAWALDGAALPAESIAHLARFALQTLQDAYAGAKNEAEAQAAWAKKRAALIDGTIGTRGDGTGASMETIVARSVMRNAAKVKFGKDSPQWAKFTGLADADQIAKLDEWLAGPSGTALASAIAKEITLRKERAANKVSAAKGLDIEI
jgi:hypothetical protein